MEQRNGINGPPALSNACNCLIEVDSDGNVNRVHEESCEYFMLLEAFAVAMGRIFASATKQEAYSLRDGYIREWKDGKRWPK